MFTGEAVQSKSPSCGVHRHQSLSFQQRAVPDEVIEGIGRLESSLDEFEPRPIGPDGISPVPSPTMRRRATTSSVPNRQRAEAPVFVNSRKKKNDSLLRSSPALGLLWHSSPVLVSGEEDCMSDGDPLSGFCSLPNSTTTATEDDLDDFSPLDLVYPIAPFSRTTRPITHQDVLVDSLREVQSLDTSFCLEAYFHAETSEKPIYQQDGAAVVVSVKHQAAQWQKHFILFQQFRRKNGHSNVPNSNHPSLNDADPEMLQLARWVKRQKYQRKLKNQGKPSSLTEERQALLDSVGFVWDSHQTSWLGKYTKLKAWFHMHGHSAVPSDDPDRALAVWVKTQRRHRKLLRRGATSPMTPDRLGLLEELHFDWDPRNLESSRSRHQPSSSLSGGFGYPGTS